MKKYIYFKFTQRGEKMKEGRKEGAREGQSEGGRKEEYREK